MAARSDTLFSGAPAPATAPETRAEPMTAQNVSDPLLNLARFMPFRLNRLAAGVSDHLAGVYRQRFGLEIPEWRIIATVGYESSCTAQHIADRTHMHKTRVSRAIANLVRRELIERNPNVDDRREMELRLSRAGRALYAELVPLALERERALLACLSELQLRAFNQGLDRLEETLGLL